MLQTQPGAADATNAADAYQDAVLPKVSRTFALTIPQLPDGLRQAVTNAYLLCRIADTIEDEPAFTAEQKRDYENAFIDAVTGRADARRVAADIAARLSASTSADERELMAKLPLVLEVTGALNQAQRDAIVECLKVMSHGMHDFQRDVGVQGLPTLRDMDRYCYCVAGVVGEMLAELLIDFEPSLQAKRKTLMHLAVSFGQGLQMTNILKDQWEDRRNGVCWLPQDVFARYGVRLEQLSPERRGEGYAKAMLELIGVAHSHLRNAMEYTLMVPAKQAGYRRFCLWSIGLAVLTLRSIQDNLSFSAGDQVKISRASVARTIAAVRFTGKYDAALRWLFAGAARKLPLTPLSAEWQERSDPMLAWPKSAIAYFTEAASCAEPALCDADEAKDARPT